MDMSTVDSGRGTMHIELDGSHRDGIDRRENLVRLRLQDIGFVGRTREQEQLRTAWRQVSTHALPPNIAPVAVVSGSSGVGKSALVSNTFGDDNNSCLYCAGKVLQVPSNRPWQAILGALDDLCGQIWSEHHDQASLQQVEQAILHSLGCKTGVLITLVPSLALLANVRPEPRSASFRTEFAFSMLKSLFSDLLRVFCKELGHCVVMFIDDVQWADVSSLEILLGMTKHAENSVENFLLVLAYRNDENMPKPLQSCLKSIQPVVRVRLEELCVESVNEVVSRALGSTRERTHSLAQVVHKKTNGNVFFTLELLRTLESDRFLTFSYSSFQWQWDVESVLAEVDVSTNVVDLLVKKFAKLPSDTQKVLMVGACIGTRFGIGVVNYLLVGPGHVSMQRLFDTVQDRNCPERQYAPFVMTERRISEALQCAVDESLLDHRRGSGMYKFAHDQIQHAIYMLLADRPERYRLHLRIGSYFHDAHVASTTVSTTLHIDENLLMAVDQMNQASNEVVADERLRLVQLNNEAATLVASLSAFESAVAYSKAARLVLVNEGGWKQHFLLMLKTSEAMASHLYATGDYIECQAVAYEILSSTENLCDKIVTHVLLIRCAVAQGRLRDCVDLAATFMQHLSITFHARPSRRTLITEHRKIRRRVKRLADDSHLLETMATAGDTTTIAAMDVLTELTGAALALGDFNLIYYCGIRSMQLTVDRGICSPTAFTLYGAFLANVLHDFEHGYAIGQLGLQVSDLFNAKWQKGRVIFWNNYWFGFLRRPLHMSLNLALNAHSLCMADGDVQFGCLSLLNYVWSYLWAGLPLEPILEDHEHLVSVLKQYNRESELRMHYSGSIIVRVLSGREERHTSFKVIDEATGEGWVFAKVKAFWQNFVLSVYFNDVHTIMNELKHMEAITLPHSGSAVASFVKFFYLGLAYFILFGHNRRHKYLRCGRRILARFAAWTKKGNVNCLHMHVFLAAESVRACFDPSRCHDDVRKAYDKAIVSCSRGGFLHHLALANERAGTYCLPNDTVQASFYMETAVQYYREWNAHAKVKDILRRYGTYLSPMDDTSNHSSSNNGGAFYGRSRLENLSSTRRLSITNGITSHDV